MHIKKVLVSQPKPSDFEKSPYSDLVKKHDLEFDFHKFIQVEQVSAKEFRSTKIKILDYSAIILTSRKAADHFFGLCKKLRVEIPTSMKYFCTSESTAFYLQNYVQYRKRKIFYSNQNNALFLEQLKKNDDDKFLIPSSEGGKKTLEALLDKENINYQTAVMFRTTARDLSKLKIDDYQLIILFSPTGLDSLIQNFPDFKQGKTLIAAFGPATQKAVKAAKLRLDISVPTPKAPSMSMAIDQYLDNLKAK